MHNRDLSARERVALYDDDDAAAAAVGYDSSCATSVFTTDGRTGSETAMVV